MPLVWRLRSFLPEEGSREPSLRASLVPGWARPDRPGLLLPAGMLADRLVGGVLAQVGNTWVSGMSGNRLKAGVLAQPGYTSPATSNWSEHPPTGLWSVHACNATQLASPGSGPWEHGHAVVALWEQANAVLCGAATGAMEQESAVSSESGSAVGPGEKSTVGTCGE